MYCFQKALVSRKFVTNNSIGGRYLDYCWKFANICIIDEHDNMFRAEGLNVFPVNCTDNHWGLIFVDFNSSTIYIWDVYGRRYEGLKIYVICSFPFFGYLIYKKYHYI